MEKKYSVASLVLVILGLALAIQPFSPFNIPFITNWKSVFIGFLIFIVGIAVGVIAIIKKEKGFIKYLSLSTVAIGIAFVLFLLAIVGQV